MNHSFPHSSRSAFTLIELLVVIAIIAILAVVVVLTLNPAALLQQSRDSSRVSDMSTLNSAITLYSTDQSGASTFNIGSSSVIYVSLPDPNASTTAGSNCSSLGLPALPAGYTYHCAGPNYYRNVNGSGWIPVNLSNISTGAPVGSLPVDPTNASSSHLYYTYETNGTQFETTAAMESQKYQLGGSNDVISPDGGPLASVYEKGSKFGMEPLDYGDPTLVGYWPLNEGTNTIAYDDSGNSATGSWGGTQAGTNGYYSAGKVQSWAGYFDGTNNYVNVGTNIDTTFTGTNSWTVSGWGYYSGLTTNYQSIFGGAAGSVWLGLNQTTAQPEVSYNGANVCVWGAALSNGWHFLVGTRNASTWMIYVDGLLANTCSNSASISYSNSSYLGLNSSTGGYWYQGSINDVRIYNRALSAAQIAALYNGGK